MENKLIGNLHQQQTPSALIEMYEGLKSQKPGPVLNFDLVYLSPKYTNLMHSLLNQNLFDPKKRQNQFTDWS